LSAEGPSSVVRPLDQLATQGLPSQTAWRLPLGTTYIVSIASSVPGSSVLSNT